MNCHAVKPIGSHRLVGPVVTGRVLSVIALVGLALGCTGEGHEHDHDQDHGGGGHVHTAPHGGALVSLGDHFAHLEVVLEPRTGDVQVYVLDGEVEKGLRVPDESLTFSLTVPDAAGTIELAVSAVESTLTGETVGDSGTFAGRAEGLVGVERFSAVLEEVTVRGTTIRDVSFRYPEGNEEGADDHAGDHDADDGHDHDDHDDHEDHEDRR